MRTKTLASLLILCGSTAAISALQAEPQQMTANNTVTNNVTTDDNTSIPAPAPSGTPEPQNTTDDAPPRA